MAKKVDQRFDIVIAGGGMVGLSLALQLGQLLDEKVRIALVEGFELPTSDNLSDYHPSFDARSTALSFSSHQIFSKMGLWQQLATRLSPISTIHVSSRGRFGSVLLDAKDHEWSALGYVVENNWLGVTLLQAVTAQGRVELLSPATVTSAQTEEDGVSLQLSGTDSTCLHANLLVVADGAQSALRKQLGFSVSEKPYGQHALIANVATSESHQGCAFERFTDQGPLALLPLLPIAGSGPRSALVWTLPVERAERLHGCTEDEFIAELQQRFGYRLGRLTQVGERHTYPLVLIHAAEQVRKGIVVMGNAAHALHPVAGQGFNLALRDIAVLGRVLAEGMAQLGTPGDLNLLQRYQQLQRADQQRTVTFSDRLPELFARTDPLLSVLRDLGLIGLDLSWGAKHEFVRQTAGVASMAEVSGG